MFGNLLETGGQGLARAEVCPCAFSAPPGWGDAMVISVKPPSLQHAQLPLLPSAFLPAWLCVSVPDSLVSPKARLARPPVCLSLPLWAHYSVERGFALLSLPRAWLLGFLCSRTLSTILKRGCPVLRVSSTAPLTLSLFVTVRDPGFTSPSSHPGSPTSSH